jgi:hypothetical protein
MVQGQQVYLDAPNMLDLIFSTQDNRVSSSGGGGTISSNGGNLVDQQAHRKKPCFLK